MTNKVVLQAFDALAGQIVYLGDAKRILRFDASQGGLRECEAPANHNTRIVIVGKQYYTEVKKHYPIQNKRELKQILDLEYPSDSAAASFFTIGEFKDGGRSVVVWQVTGDLHELTGIASGLLIPEGALINSALEDKSLMTLRFDNIQQEQWFYRDHNGKPFSGAKRGLIQSADRFLASVGIAETVESQVLSWSDYIQFLQRHLPKFVVQSGVDFFYSHSSVIPDFSALIKPFSLIATVLVGSYFAISSTYLVFRNSWAEEEAARLTQEARNVFHIRDQAKDKFKQLDELSMLSDGVSASSLIWKDVGALMKEGVEFQSISFLPDGRYILRGNADSATNVLSVFSGNTTYIGAKFYSATQRRKERDYFSISTQLASQVAESGNE